MNTKGSESGCTIQTESSIRKNWVASRNQIGAIDLRGDSEVGVGSTVV